MADHKRLTLRVPTPELAREYLAMVDEHIAAGEGYPYNNVELARRDFAAFVQELEDEARGVGLPPGIPPQQTYLLALEDGTVVGEFRFRPALSEPYAENSGHLGYNIRPTARRLGYATRGLELLVEEARRLGLAGLMLTVEGHNPGSVRAIERNGGALVQQRTKPRSGRPVACYWIDLMGG